MSGAAIATPTTVTLATGHQATIYPIGMKAPAVQNLNGNNMVQPSGGGGAGNGAANGAGTVAPRYNNPLTNPQTVPDAFTIFSPKNPKVNTLNMILDNTGGGTTKNFTFLGNPIIAPIDGNAYSAPTSASDRSAGALANAWLQGGGQIIIKRLIYTASPVGSGATQFPQIFQILTNNVSPANDTTDIFASAGESPDYLTQDKVLLLLGITIAKNNSLIMQVEPAVAASLVWTLFYV